MKWKFLQSKGLVPVIMLSEGEAVTIVQVLDGKSVSDERKRELAAKIRRRIET